MKRLKLITLLSVSLIGLAFTFDNNKLISKKSHIKFYSHTNVEDITANNYKAVSTIDKNTGEVVFSVPMQGFEFEKALMQKHFNNKNFLDTKTYPKAKFTGKITNLNSIDFNKPGEYEANVEGDLTIKDRTNAINEKGKIIVKEGNKVSVHTKLFVTLADYGIEFTKGKPSRNIAKQVEVTLIADYE